MRVNMTSTSCNKRVVGILLISDVTVYNSTGYTVH